MKYLLILIPLTIFSQSNRNPNNLTTRNSSGAPGAGYWQQQVDYKAEAELFPATKTLVGKETINYKNNSPDTLTLLVWHLYQNIFKKGFESNEQGNIVGRAMTNTKGISIKKIEIESKSITPKIDRTLMETKLPTPLLPNSSIEIFVEWEYEIPNVASLRTGSTGENFGICQWYPQIAVYDDQRGWDKEQYLGQGEFYLEYGNWDAKITLPANFIVCATGTLQNSNQVLTAEQLNRFNEVNSAKVTQIIPPSETDTVRNKLKNEKRTWHFTANDVRDFAWAASPNYVWDATMTANNVRIYAFYYEGLDSTVAPYRWFDKVSNWDDGANMARHAIEYFSNNFGNYIYPQATVVSGPVYGMEYPMFIFAGNGDPFTTSLYQVIAHELGHEWYPMMIGSQETNYAFMDEGFNTFITSNAVHDRYGNKGWLHKDFNKDFGKYFREADDRLLNQRSYLWTAISNSEAPLMTHSNLARSDQYGVLAYQKPGTILFMLKDVLGDEVFKKALLDYYNRWLLKHPYPEDFFNTIENISGKDLDWFWNEWFYKTSKLDYAIINVENNPNKNSSTIKLEKKNEAIMPFTLQVELENGKIYNYRVSETYSMFNKTFNFDVGFAKSEISRIIIDPEIKLADVDRTNNSWPRFSFKDYEINFGFGIINSVLPPLDKKVLNIGPSFGYNYFDGTEIGLNISTSYMNKYNNSEKFRYDLKNGKKDIDLNFSRTASEISPDLDLTFSILNSDGRKSRGVGANYFFTNYSGMFGNLITKTTFQGKITSMILEDDKYVDSKLWSRGNLVYGIFEITRSQNKKWGNTSLSFKTEFGLPGSEFYYGKTSIEGIVNWNKLALRFFGGTIEGESIPEQTRFSTNLPTELELSENSFFRTKVFAGDMHQKFTLAGGGNLFAKNNFYGNNIVALNSSYSFGILKLLANTGFATNNKILLKEVGNNLYTDLAIGFSIDAKGINIFNFSNLGFGIYLPFAEKNPAEKFNIIKSPGQRLRIVAGVRI